MCRIRSLARFLLSGGSGNRAGTRKKVLASHAGIKLLLGSFFNSLGEGGCAGDGTEVGWFGRSTGFVDGVDNGMLPGLGKFTRCEAGVENEEKDVADDIKT